MQSVASVTCLYLCTVRAFQVVLDRELGIMHNKETEYKVCIFVCLRVCLRVGVKERGGGSRRRGRKCDATAVAD